MNQRFLFSWPCALLLAHESALAFQPTERRAKLPPTGGVRVPRTTTDLAVAMPFDDEAVPPSIADSLKNVPTAGKEQLAPEDEWIGKLDFDAFGKDVSALGRELRNDHGEADVEHLYKLVKWRNIAAVLGLATVWMAPNPVTIVALSTWTYSSWAMIAHHTCHGGYNRVDAGKRFKSRQFALGLVNRFVDWLDWMQPEAWNVEHNRLHHYNLNEGKDPDLVQRNLEFLRSNDKVPMIAKYAVVLFFLPIWKWFYYSPNTYKELRINELLKSSGGTEQGVLPEDFDREQAATVLSILDPISKQGRALRKVIPPHKLFLEVLGPMLIGRYVMVPALLWALIPGAWGPIVAGHAFWNLLAAELLTNVHAFVTIVTNHGACAAEGYCIRFNDNLLVTTKIPHAFRFIPFAIFLSSTCYASDSVLGL